MSDDELFDDDDSFADAIANMDGSMFEADSQKSTLANDDDDDNDDDGSLPSSKLVKVRDNPPPTTTAASDAPSSKALRLLKQFYGYSSFRHVQWKIIRAVTEERRDHCVVMATGSGKSLCYQFPALLTEKVSVVICPLISLMEDQVMALEVRYSRKTRLSYIAPVNAIFLRRF